MSKPTPAHHKTVDIGANRLRNGYGLIFQASIEGVAGWWQIVSAASVGYPSDMPPPEKGYARVIVAPARVAP